MTEAMCPRVDTGDNDLEMVDQNSVSWNHVKNWLSYVDALRAAARYHRAQPYEQALRRAADDPPD